MMVALVANEIPVRIQTR